MQLPDIRRSPRLSRFLAIGYNNVVLDLDRQNHWREAYRAAHPGWQPATERYFAIVTNQLRPESRVLDLGCGRGGLVEQLPEPTPWVAGVDPDWRSLREHRITSLPRAAALSNALPFVAHSFDLIVASWLLEHLDRPRETLTEVARLLDDGGRFIFLTPNGRHPLTIANRVFGRAGRWQKRLVDRAYGRDEGDTFPTHYQANTPAALKMLSDAAGLQVIRLQSIADPTYLAFTPALFRLMSAFDALLPLDRQIHLVGVLGK